MAKTPEGSSSLGNRLRGALVTASDRTAARTQAMEVGPEPTRLHQGVENERQTRETLPCTAPGEVASEGETDRKRPQKREHRTRTDTHTRLRTRPARAPGAASGSQLGLMAILHRKPPSGPLPSAGPWHCPRTPRKPNLQVAGQPEGHQVLKANLPLKVTAKS